MCATTAQPGATTRVNGAEICEVVEKGQLAKSTTTRVKTIRAVRGGDSIYDLSHVAKLTQLLYTNQVIMKNLTIIKQYSNIQSAHVYEHLFSRAVNELFFAHGLYKGLDYFLRGTTYTYSGLITVDIDAYTPDAIEVLSKVPKLSVDTSLERLSTALTQVIVENDKLLEVSDMDAVRRALIEIDEQGWVSLDDYEAFDEEDAELVDYPIKHTKQSTDVEKITIDVHVEKESIERKLTPLFWKLSNIIILTATDIICAKYNTYLDSNSVHSRSSACRAKLLVAGEQTDKEIDAMLWDFLSVSNKIMSSDFKDRLVSQLSNLSYSNNFYGAPNTDMVAEDTHIYIGKKGWQSIATVQNIDKILDNITVQIKHGDYKRSARLT